MALEVNIKKRLGDFKLDVAFTADGGVLAILGASGCGKSMTLKCIAGIETPDRGRIVLNGRTLFDSDKRINLSPQERRVGYLFQDYALFPDMTVEENIMAGVRGGTRYEKRAIAFDKMEAFGLASLSHLKPAQLSGGQKQRVALARIIVNQPEVLLLDEPFTALDNNLKWQLELDLTDTLKSFYHDVVFVSHNRAEVYRLCESVCVLTNGRSEPKRTVRDLFAWPGTVSAARITGCKNISKGVKAAPRQIFASHWGVRLATAVEVPFETAYVGVRAHAWKVTKPGEPHSIRCTVRRVVEDVFSVILMLKPPGEELLRMELSKVDWAALSDHTQIDICVDPAEVMLLSE